MSPPPTQRADQVADFRFVKREDGFGEEAVDLHTCLLIRLSDPESSPDGELYHFYRTPTDQWIEHRGEPEYDEGKMYWSESISFVDKIVVAHVLLINKIYDGLLPNTTP